MGGEADAMGRPWNPFVREYRLFAWQLSAEINSSYLARVVEGHTISGRKLMTVQGRKPRGTDSEPPSYLFFLAGYLLILAGLAVLGIGTRLLFGSELMYRVGALYFAFLFAFGGIARPGRLFPMFRLLRFLQLFRATGWYAGFSSVARVVVTWVALWGDPRSLR